MALPSLQVVQDCLCWGCWCQQGRKHSGEIHRGSRCKIQSFSDYLQRAEAVSRTQLFLQKRVSSGHQWKMIIVLSQNDIFNKRKGSEATALPRLSLIMSQNWEVHLPAERAARAFPWSLIPHPCCEEQQSWAPFSQQLWAGEKKISLFDIKLLYRQDAKDM